MALNFTLEENVSAQNGPPAQGPLESLYLNPYQSYVMSYPRDLGASYRNHTVQFMFYEQVSQEFDMSLTGVQDFVVKESDKFINSVQNATSSSTTGLNFAAPINYSSYKGAINLYMPDTLEFNYDADYSNLSVLEAVQSKLTGRLGEAITSVVDDAATKLVLNQAGYVFNPQQQLLFNGIDFRTYSMSFTFTPHSNEEAITVNEIIKKFKSYAAPEVVSGAAGFFFKPPGIVYISFQSNGQENEYLQKVKKSVIESVSVNYAPNGWASVGDNGAPVQTTMTVQFKEMELVDRKDIAKGY